MSPRPRRTVRVVIKARQAREAASGLRQVAAAVENAALEAHVELDLCGPETVGAVKDAKLTQRVHQDVGDALDELAVAVQHREEEVRSGKSVPPPPTAVEARKSVVQRVEAFTRSGGRILVAVKALADIIVSVFYPKA